MNPRQARRERRAAERKAKKLELKKSRLAPHALAHAAPEVAEDFPDLQPRWNPVLEDEFSPAEQIQLNAMADRVRLRAGLPRRPQPAPAAPPEVGFVSQAAAVAAEPGFVSQPHPKPKRTRAASNRAAINRANAQLSTGPTSSHGKLASSRNATKHGLAAGVLLIPGEDPAAFDALLQALLAEHQPTCETESLLLNEIAQSYWLTQRALRLQNTCFTDEGVNEKQLALFLRYQTTHERRFYKALQTLLKLRKTNRTAPSGFVSQHRPASGPPLGFVSHNATGDSPGEQFVRQNEAGSARGRSSQSQTQAA